MLVASFFSWWYGSGWRLHAAQVSHRLSRVSEFFSIFQLLRTLFAPYRQISAGRVKGNLTIQWHAFLDRLFSRVIGFCVRVVLLVIGVISLVVMSVASVVWLLVWPILPALPIVFIALALTGVSA